jgi:hypothetical protein
VITCTVEEHVMFSESSGWRDGKSLWLVTHKADDGPGLEATGSLPPQYASIRDHFTALQQAENDAEAEVDYLFEIPVELARSFAAYKHDEASPAFETQGFEILESASWLGRLFSR